MEVVEEIPDFRAWVEKIVVGCSYGRKVLEIPFS